MVCLNAQLFDIFRRFVLIFSSIFSYLLQKCCDGGQKNTALLIILTIPAPAASHTALL